MIELKQFSFGYKQGKQQGKNQKGLFQDASLTLAPGNIYGLLGLNGAGKSTLLQLMAGLLFPDEGSMNVLGNDPARRSPSLLSRIFFLPETIVVPNITDKEYVSINAPFYPNFDHEHMKRCLSEFEVPSGRKLITLSHGQQKKFLLAFGLSCKTDLLILDEPTNGLDIPSKGLFRRLVVESVNDEQIFVVSTHQVRDVETLIDSILVLHEGQILLNQGVDTVTSNLRMSQCSSLPSKSDNLLYSEQTVGGFATVSRDTNADDGKLDLELLFKAVIANPGIYTHLFEGARAE